jgi:hypothetical protein
MEIPMTMELISNVNSNLGKIDDFDYNIFELDELLEKHTLPYLSMEIMSKLNYFEEKLLGEEKFRYFLREVTKGYDRNVTYHNDLHAADVLQTTYIILMKGDLRTVNI